MPGGSAALIEAVYAGGAAATDRLGGLVAACVAAWAGALPDHRPVRVLEVGGGTGGTTRLVLAALAAVRPGTEYLFTDVSPSFLPEAARRFAATLPGFATARLDISADPAAQGQQPGAFDIVLAADVLHATPDLARSLAHCRRLLRAGGLLVLNETTRVRDFATLTFGLTDGWWCATDRARRLPFGPAAAAETWRELLAEAGFAAQRSLPPERAAPDAFQTLFVAEAGPDAGAPRSANALRVAAAPVAATDLLHAHLAALVGATLKLDPAALHPAEPFGTYGLESVMALEVIAALEADFGTLPKTLLFEAASIADLADWLRRENPSATAAIHARERGLPPVPLPSTPAAAAVPANANDLFEGAIAVVALAGRFPGARSPEALWELLREGRSGITEVPAERWDHAPHYDPTRTDDTKAHSKWGGFVDGADRFDAALFHISPAEARATDPMERQFIEVAWELLENAGHAPERLKAAARNPLGGDVGVFVGVMSQTYEQLATEIWAKGVYTGAFSSHSSIANRVSFLFDFTGPSCGVDTACSSSLTAVHLACEAIRRGDCRAAIAGGVNLLLHPLHHILLSAYRVLSPDNRTRAFGEGGTGFVVGEGIGAVLLRPLADALRDGDPVLAVVRGSAVNTSGRTSSYSAPSVEAQAAVVTAALARAGVDPRSIGCVEAHGTGTELGDPVEIRALAKAWGAWTADRGFCAIGSVKSNIGHLECAAGIAGLAKLLLQFRHRTLAPSLDAEPPNPHLDLGATPFRVQTRLGAWDPPADGGPRRAAISSFGLGGANAHLVLEEWPAPPPGATDDGAPLLVPISARTEERLRAHLARLAGHLRQALAAGDAPSLRDVAWTLQVGRQALPERWAAVATDVPGFVDAAEGWLQGRVSPGVRHGRVGRVGHSAHAGDPPHPSLAADPAAMAAHWVAGGRIEPELLLRGERRPRIVPLPNYPFEPRRFWLTDGKGFSKAEVSASRAAERAAPQATEPVAAYYDATLPVREDRLDEAYFSLAPFAEPRPGFSWTRTVLDPEAEPEAAATLLEAQRAMRRALLAGLDLADGPRRVLDIGCGAATDLIALARANPRLTAHGRTLAAEHARVAAARVRLAGLADRVAIEVGDSAGSPFPGPPFDLVLGIEVVHHVRDKDALFGNIAAALAPAGRVALADCVAPRVAVSVAETGSFTLAEPAYAELLARHGLRIMRAVDASAGVAHCLADEGLPQVLAHLAARGLPAARLELVEKVHAGWANFGRALAEGGIRYMLLQIGPDRATDTSGLAAANRAALASATPYTAPTAERADSALATTVLDCLAQVLGTTGEDIDPHAAFVEQGLDSLGGLRFLDALARRLDVTLGTEALYDHPTLAALTAHIAGTGAASQRAAPASVTEARPMPAAVPATLAPAVARLPATAPASVEPAPVAPDAIAVVGLAVRLPGAPDQRALWRVLRDGVDCVSEVPADRWDAALHYSPDPEARDHTYGKWGGFLDSHDRFDARFFGISAREAALMDPQHRVFLETAWHALEDAGLTGGDALAGARCGAFVGLTGDEYRELLRLSGAAPDAYAMLGNSGSILAARLAYLLDLKGPALAVDTACSSSLVAVHLAAEAILRGEVDLAIAGGVSLYLSEWPFKQMSRAGMLSPTGRCRAFGAAADGIAPAEGAGAVVLKPLARALADRDQVYGVIRATGLNQDGRTNGITAPSAAAQAALIGEVLDRARIPVRTVTMLEAHGTGTRLGDPIEAAGLVAAFGARTPEAGFCALGTIKSNVGHTTAAAGVAGLAKVLLSLRHRTIPPTLHAEAPNPLVRLDGSAFVVNTAARPWTPAPGAPRRAGLSAFGFSGTNAHAIVEEAPTMATAVPEGEAPPSGFRLVALSARDASALGRQASALADWLAAAEPPPALADIAYTLNLRRRHETPARAAFVVPDTASLVDALRSFRERSSAPRAVGGVAPPRPAAVHPASPAWRDWLQGVASAYEAGGEVAWSELDEGEAVRVVALPGYSFARERHWFGEPPGAPAEPSTASAAVLAPSPRLFAPLWVPAEPSRRSATPAAAGPMIAFVESAEDADRLLAAGVPGPILPVRAGSVCDLSGPVPAIRPDAPEDYRVLLSRAGEDGSPPRGAVHLWPLASARGSVEDALRRGPRSLFLTVQALLGAVRPGEAPLSLIQAYALGNDAAAAVCGASGGLVPSVSQATDGVRLSVLGLDAEAAQAPAVAVARALAEEPGGDARLIGGRWFVRRVAPVAASAGELGFPPLGPGAAVLVSGGLGGIGRALCLRLARRGAAALAVIGRAPLDAERRRALDALRAAGARAEYRSADVADAASLAEALQELRGAVGPFARVYHLAGTMGSAALPQKSAAEFDAVLRAKVAGTLALDAATASDPLDAFVLAGSLAATVGDAGQGDYSVANRFLEHFAEMREAERLGGRRAGRTCCVAWPLWTEGGLRPEPGAAALLARLSGLEALPTEAGLASLDSAWASARPVVLVAAGSPERIAARLPLAPAGSPSLPLRAQPRTRPRRPWSRRTRPVRPAVRPKRCSRTFACARRRCCAPTPARSIRRPDWPNTASIRSR